MESNVCYWKVIIEKGWFNKVEDIYGKDFPWQVRNILSTWLTQDDSFKSWSPYDSSHYESIYDFIDKIIAELKRLIKRDQLTSQSDPAKSFLYQQSLAALLKQLEEQDPLYLFQAIKDTLARETQRVEELVSVSMNVSATFSSSQTDRQLQNKLCDIKDELAKIEEKCTEMEAWIPDICERLKPVPEMKNRSTMSQQQYTIQAGSSEQRTMATVPGTQTNNEKLLKDLEYIFATADQIMSKLSSIHSKILNELEFWRDEQRLVALGKPPVRDLNCIRNWFESIAKCMDILETHLPNLKDSCEKQNDIPVAGEELNKIVQAKSKVIKLRRQMRNVSLVISRQPDEIIKADRKFGPVGLVVLLFCTNMTVNPAVKAVFVNDKTAVEYFDKDCNNYCDSKRKVPEKAGDLEGVPKVTSKCEIEFSTMTMTKFLKRSKKDNKQQKVMDQRYWIYFRVIVNYDGRTVNLHTVSLPIAVTTNTTSQDGRASSHILWHNSVPMANRLHPLQVPDEIQCTWLIDAINLKFLDLGRELTEEQKDHLIHILFYGPDGHRLLDMEQPLNTEIVTKRQFCSDTFTSGKIEPEDEAEETSSEDGKAGKSTDKNYSFGEWLFACLRILSWAPKNRKYAEWGMKHLWKNEQIVGFMSKKKIEDLLEEKKKGTFLLRFPENQPAYLGIYFRGQVKRRGYYLITQEVNISSLNEKPLQDHILDSKVALYLYPDIDKEVAFTRMNQIKKQMSVVSGYFPIIREEVVSESVLHDIGIENEKPAEKEGKTIAIPGPSSSHSFRSNFGFAATCNNLCGRCCAGNKSNETYNAQVQTTKKFSTSLIDGIDPRVLMEDDDEDME